MRSVIFLLHPELRRGAGRVEVEKEQRVRWRLLESEDREQEVFLWLNML